MPIIVIQGMEGDDLDQEIDSFIVKLGITAKQHAQVSTLSGGQKRAVSVALALVGRPTTVILDEPTSGIFVEFCRCLCLKMHFLVLDSS